MTTLLVVEASTAAGSVALVHNGEVIGERDASMGVSRDDALLPAIVELLESCAVAPSALSGIVCGSGPGSFTSLRIAASLCKGLASAHATPLYAVSSLLLAAAVLSPTAGSYLLHADALRGERYVLPVDIGVDGCVVAAGEQTRVPQVQLTEIARNAARQLVTVDAVEGETDGVRVIAPHARGVSKLALPLSAFGPVSLADWEPAYGRLAEAQVKWELDHGRPLPVS